MEAIEVVLETKGEASGSKSGEEASAKESVVAPPATNLASEPKAPPLDIAKESEVLARGVSVLSSKSSFLRRSFRFIVY